MVMMEPEHYFVELYEETKRKINRICAQEDKHGSIVSHLVWGLKGLFTSNDHKLEEALKAKSDARRLLIQSR